MELDETLKNAGSKVGSYGITQYETKDFVSSGLLGETAMFLLRNASSYIINSYSLRNAMRGMYATSERNPIILIDKGEDGKIAGMAALMFEKNEKGASIASGFVATAKEVRSHGIGHALIQRSIEIAKKNGYGYLANVDQSNMASRKTMESNDMHITGFHTEGRHQILEYTI
jgi:GNAT superfamily N-acetyltransferase